MAKAPSAFISYSWDNAPHKKCVRQIASRLVRNGVKVALDQWDVAPGDDLAAFMVPST
jgi:TIR domain